MQFMIEASDHTSSGITRCHQIADTKVDISAFLETFWGTPS